MQTLKRTREIDAQTKLSVTGYIRLNHKSLFNTNQYALFQNVPDSIYSLCILYLHLQEYFDRIHQSFRISEDKSTINHKAEFWNNSNYGKFVISSTESCIYKWYLKINYKPSSSHQYNIGISSAPYDTSSAFCWQDKKHYNFWPRFGGGSNAGYDRYSSHKRDTPKFEKMEFAKQIEENDILCMELNLKERNISFYINDENQGVLFKNVDTGKDIEYKLSITLAGNDTSISITNFTQTF